MITFQSLGKYGRLGNQMFQYATLVGVAKEKKYQFGIPYQNKSSDQFNNLELTECFKNISALDSSHMQMRNNYHESDFCFQQNLFNITDNTNIHGYFQSPKYFDKYKQHIKHEFTFHDAIYDKARSVIQQYNGNKIAMHMRLGDYTSLSHVYPICSLLYYQTALQKMPPNSHVLLFSDDIESAKHRLSQIPNINYVSTGNKYVDLCIMTMCDYHVICNSSFSWWGAYLSNSQKVVAPSDWFANSSAAPKCWHTIFVDGWERLCDV